MFRCLGGGTLNACMFFFFHRMVFKATQVALLFLDFLVVSEIDSSFPLNKHGDPPPPPPPPPIFFQVFAKNSLIKNIFEEEKKFDGRTWFFLEKSPLLDVFWPRPVLQANHGTIQKSAIFPNQATKNNTAYVNKWRFTFKIKFCVFRVSKT